MVVVPSREGVYVYLTVKANVMASGDSKDTYSLSLLLYCLKHGKKLHHRSQPYAQPLWIARVRLLHII